MLDTSCTVDVISVFLEARLNSIALSRPVFSSFEYLSYHFVDDTVFLCDKTDSDCEHSEPSMYSYMVWGQFKIRK